MPQRPSAGCCELCRATRPGCVPVLRSSWSCWSWWRVVYIERGHAAHPGAVRQADGGPDDVRRPGDVLPDEGEHLGRDSAHLRRRAPLASRPRWGTGFPFLADGAAGASSATPGSTTALFVLLIIFFTYFYTTLTFRSDDVADNIKKQGGYIPGIRPGRQTAEYITRRAEPDHLRRRASTSPSSASSRPSSPTAAFGGCPSSSAARRCSSWWAWRWTPCSRSRATSSAATTRASPVPAGRASAVDCGRPHSRQG